MIRFGSLLPQKIVPEVNLFHRIAQNFEENATISPNSLRQPFPGRAPRAHRVRVGAEHGDQTHVPGEVAAVGCVGIRRTSWPSLNPDQTDPSEFTY
jgi:hypothetical protein